MSYEEEDTWEVSGERAPMRRRIHACNMRRRIHGKCQVRERALV
jgi:hypothetical protein